MVISHKIVLRFPPQLVEKPIIYRLVKDFDLEFNILKASISPKIEGLLVMELVGEEANFNSGIKYIRDAGVDMEPLSQNIVRSDERCTHCGACVAFCPVGAFTIDPISRKIQLNNSKCIACELCIRACPLRAMEIKL